MTHVIILRYETSDVSLQVCDLLYHYFPIKNSSHVEKEKETSNICRRYHAQNAHLFLVVDAKHKTLIYFPVVDTMHKIADLLFLDVYITQ